MPPPFENLAQGRIAMSHVLEIAGRIGRIGERGDDIDDDEPPRLAVPDASDLLSFKKDEFAQGLAPYR